MVQFSGKCNGAARESYRNHCTSFRRFFVTSTYTIFHSPSLATRNEEGSVKPMSQVLNSTMKELYFYALYTYNRERKGEVAEMTKFERLNQLVEEGNGYLLTERVTAEGISKPYLAEYVKRRGLERVAQGVYMSKNAWPDAFYLLYLKNKGIVFSYESALYLHGLTEREPFKLTVTVKAGYNASHLRCRGILVHQVKKELFELGQSVIRTNFGNEVAVYDMERTICDVIGNREHMDVQIFRTALKEYAGHKGKNLNNLMRYAQKLKRESAVRRYMEVLL